jgi:hypothetical protein
MRLTVSEGKNVVSKHMHPLQTTCNDKLPEQQIRVQAKSTNAGKFKKKKKNVCVKGKKYHGLTAPITPLRVTPEASIEPLRRSKARGGVLSLGVVEMDAPGL